MNMQSTPSKQLLSSKDKLDYSEDHNYQTPDKQFGIMIPFPRFESPSYFMNPNQQMLASYNNISFKKIEQFEFDNQEEQEDNDSIVDSQPNNKWIQKQHLLLDDIDQLIIHVQGLLQASEVYKREPGIPHFDLRSLDYNDEEHDSDIQIFQNQNNSIIVDITLQMKKSLKSIGEEIGYFFDGNCLKRVYNCQHCKALFEKACSLGGHMSRVHKLLVLKDDEQIKKRIKKIR